MFLPEDTLLGHLKIIEVYDYYDGPRLFAAQNTVGTIFLSFWADQSETEDIWLYVPLSESRLEQIAGGFIDLRRAYTESEDNIVFKVYTSLHDKTCRIDEIHNQPIDEELLPLEGDKINLVESIQETESKITSTDLTIKTTFEHYQEVYITNTGSSNTSADGLIAFIRSWTDLIKPIMEKLGFSGNLYTKAFEPGSLKLYFGSHNGEVSNKALSIIGQLLREKNTDKIYGMIRENGINLETYDQFLKSLVDNKINIRISSIDKIGKQTNFERTEEYARYTGTEAELLRELLYDDIGKTEQNKELIRLVAKKIPQADNIQKVFELVDLIYNRERVNSYNLQLHPRQIYYYSDAARILNYIDGNRYLTPTGKYLVGLDEKQKIWLSAIQFMTSECGLAWTQWSGTQSFTKISPETAIDFLLEVSIGLSEKTIERRAKTLAAWYKQLSPSIPENLRSRD